MMRRTTTSLILLTATTAATLPAQRVETPSYVRSTTAVSLTPPRGGFGRDMVHVGKWATAAGTAALTLLAAAEHRQSRRNWDALLEICRSADDACALGANGRYLRSDAEQLYQQSRYYDRRANRMLLGAQASLLVTTALFIIDLNPGAGPDNIPFAPMRVGLSSTTEGAAVEMRLRF